MAGVLAMLLLSTLAAPPVEGRVVERIVAVVRNPAGAAPRPLTLTRLVEEARVALVGQGALEAAEAPLDEAALRAALRWLVDQWLVADEAARLKVDDVAREDAQAALRRFRDRFAGEEAYRRFLARADLAEEEVAQSLLRDLKVRRYLDSRVGRSARVTEAEVDAALAAQGAGGGDEAARQQARGRLAGEKAGAQARQLLADLRSRADVRVLAPALRQEAAR
ncbi:MAG: hypothetical protein IPO09_16135 [Anaeromyxobacter sp.]|nr:hypothetical protein [Anaeromyxobacter sp.]MBL0276111.1 hypothetical protein [Anaeromyxobacter sp.]